MREMSDKEIISLLLSKNAKLEERIIELEEEIRRLKLGKNSSNSSKPPSSDIFNPKKLKSLRTKSDNPDKIVDLYPNHCNKCGCQLDEADGKGYTRRQEIDLPAVKPITTEYRNHSIICPNCGNEQRTDFPKHLKNNIQYGINIESLISYLSVRQYIPLARIQEFFRHVFGLNIGQGSICNKLRSMANKCIPIYVRIRDEICRSRVVGSDESSVFINGKKSWVWTWQNDHQTFINISESRGAKAVQENFPEGLPNSSCVWHISSGILNLLRRQIKETGATGLKQS